MAPLYTSHVDDTLFCNYGDGPWHAFSRIIWDYRYFELGAVVLRDSERGNRLTGVESRVDSQFVNIDLIFPPGHMAEVDCSLQQKLGEKNDSNSPKDPVDHKVDVYCCLWYHIPGALNVVADCTSRFPRIIGAPLFPQLMLEHRLGVEYNRAEQVICAEYFVRLIGVEGEMFYCSYGRLWDDRYLSGWYTDYGFSGNRFTPLSGPRAMDPYDSLCYGVPGIFPWMHVAVRDGGKTVGLWFKSCSRVVIAGHGTDCTYSIQSSSPFYICDQGSLWL